jgi:hypothetical protein
MFRDTICRSYCGIIYGLSVIAYRVVMDCRSPERTSSCFKILLVSSSPLTDRVAYTEVLLADDFIFSTQYTHQSRWSIVI